MSKRVLSYQLARNVSVEECSQVAGAGHITLRTTSNPSVVAPGQSDTTFDDTCDF